MATPPYTLPQNNQPALNPNGTFQTVWYRFLNSLFQGTGSGLPLGTAATKTASNSVDAAVASVTTPITTGHIAQFADTNGTIKDGGALGTGANVNIGTSGATVPLLNGNNTWSGTNTYTSGELIAPDITSGGSLLTLPTTVDTLVGRATTDTLTNKTLTSATNVISPACITSAPIANSLSGDVTLNNVAAYFDGPSVAQGTVGTWFVSGSVLVKDTAGSAAFLAKLWDGTTLIDSSAVLTPSAGVNAAIQLSGFLASPAGNLRISVNDASSTNGIIAANSTGLGKDSTITAFRIK